MKWIGQNIYDFISRFRNDVYLESISTGTIASGAHLGLDSNNKIVKAADGGGDLTSIVAGTGLSGTSLTGPIPTLNVDAAQTQITSLGTLTSLDVDNININGDTITASGEMVLVATGDDITVDTDNFTIESAAGTKPSFTLKATIDANKPSVFNFVKDRGGAGAAGDIAGGTNYISDNDAQEQITMVTIQGAVSDATDGAEEGEYRVGIKNTANAAIPVNSFVLTGNGAHTDATIGSGTSSVTTLTGTLTMGSTAFVNNSGVIQVASQPNITGVGTIGTGTWQGTRVASAYLDTDTAHLTTDQTFTGVKTFDETIVGSVNGSAATVATIAGLAPNTATTQATQPAIESIGTDGDTLSILSDTLLMSNASADTPVIKLVNTTDDDQAGQLIFEKLRDDDGVTVGQNLGEIWFKGQDATQNTEDYAYIIAEIDVSTPNQESGKLTLAVANHDGGNGKGLILTGGSENNEVDVTVGLGANSVVTIPGNIDLAGDIDVDGTLETDALTIGGATIAAIGTTGITTLGTIGTGVWEGTAIATDQQKHLMHYQVQGFSTGSTNYVASKNISTNTAPFKHDVDIGSDGTTAKSVTVWMRMGGHVMPNACTLKRFTGWTESAGSASQTLALFRVRLADDSDTDPSAVLLQEVTYTASGNQIADYFNVTSASGGQSLDLAAGDIIFSALKGAGNPQYFNGTFEVEF